MVTERTDHRRGFLKSLLTLPLLTSVSSFGNNTNTRGYFTASQSLKVSLNAFSFNDPLTKGTMTIDDMLVFCADKGFAAVDITAYYFPGYPLAPKDDFLYHVKRKAFSLGLEISGTGVRNDFTDPDPQKRKESVTLVKNWIEAAEKIGAPVIRIFSGNHKHEGFSREQVFEWMVKDIQECIAYGKTHGVVVAVQNHDDFIKTADDAIQLMKAIPTEWFGLILDTGSYRIGDPYKQIEITAKYAVNWQIKEKIFLNGVEVEADIEKLVRIVKTSGYKGYLPLETLGAGDPRVKIPVLLDRVNKALASS